MNKGIYNELRSIEEELRRLTFRVASLLPKARPPSEANDVSQIFRAVADFYGISEAALRSHSHGHHEARSLAMFLLRTKLKLSFPDIGKRFSNRHHTTVMKVLRRVEERRGKDTRFDELVSMFMRYYP